MFAAVDGSSGQSCGARSYPVGMPWGRKRTRDDGANEPVGSVEIFTSGRGMIVEGSTTDVSLFVDRMLEATRETGGHARHFIIGGVQVAANIAAFSQTHREYVEFS